MNWNKLIQAEQQIEWDEVAREKQQEEMYEKSVREYMQTWEWKLDAKPEIVKALRGWADYGRFEYRDGMCGSNLSRKIVRATEIMLVEELEIDPSRIERVSFEVVRVGIGVVYEFIIKIKEKGE